MIGGSTMPVIEKHFKNYDAEKWEQAKEAKPSIETGMTEEISGLYDKIVEVNKKKVCTFTDSYLSNSGRKQMRVIMNLDATSVLKS